MSHARRRFVAAGAAVLTGLAGFSLAPPPAQGAGAGAATYNDKTPTSRGYGGAVTSVDPEASKIGIEVLKRGGNAVDAAVATAAALGVTEPYSSGIGGGGYFVHYDARTGKVETLDGRETAPKTMPHDAFIDPKTKEPYNFTPELVTSGVSVGTPGTLATWDTALKKWGTTQIGRALAPAAKLADRGFKVDDTFNLQTDREQAPVRQLPGDQQAVPPQRQAARSRVDPAQPRPRGDVPTDREARRSRLLRRSARSPDRAHRPAPTEAGQARPADPARLPPGR